MQPPFLQNTQIESGFDLLVLLRAHYTIGDSQSWWWPSFHSVRVANGVEIEGARVIQPDLSLCFAAILGQNTKYENAALALRNLYGFLHSVILANEVNLKGQDCVSNLNPQRQIAQPHYHNAILECLSHTAPQDIAPLIRSAGFYQQKAARIVALSCNILRDFDTFESFALQVSREWLLKQKGIGQESASSILNYALKREEMVVDSYTQRLLAHCGLFFEEYECMQSFLVSGLERAYTLYESMPLAQIMARFHGKIVECNKQYKLPKLTY